MVVAPAAPTEPSVIGVEGFLTATARNSFKIELEWFDNGTDEEGYEIEVQVFNDAYANIATILVADYLDYNNDDISYIDTCGIEPDTTYKYRVRSFRGIAKSTWLTGSATTPPWEEDDPTDVCP